MPGEKFQKEQLELLNGLYPKGEPKPGDWLKVVE
jgi:predicted Zn-dependent protease